MVRSQITADISELKSALSRYLQMAAGGMRIIVCEHGRPIAMLSSAQNGKTSASSLARHLASLAARGLVVLGTGGKRRTQPKGPRIDLSAAVIADRSERF